VVVLGGGDGRQPSSCLTSFLKKRKKPWHACVPLAQTSASAQAREEFADLARTWIRLGDDLEQMAFLDVPEDDSPSGASSCAYYSVRSPAGSPQPSPFKPRLVPHPGAFGILVIYAVLWFSFDRQSFDWHAGATLIVFGS
jgi:hypothetical protein